MKYELFYLVGASKEAELENIRKEVSAIVAENGGVFEEKETQEKRRLAYEIKHETHGIYTAQRFELVEAENLAKINRKLNLNAGVLRFLISKADELPELRSKEERISEEQTKEARTQKFKEEKKAEQKKAEAVEEKKEAGDKKSQPQEDIDKKLEEILNI
ncbi:MAG: ribosomal protein [Patescibacteria group bacterium]|nr:ribosomal protein [Patescibacteria group bacterium]